MRAMPLQQLDVRWISPSRRAAELLELFDRLESGQAIELISDRELGAIYTAIQFNFPGLFIWDALEAGPERWRVRIERAGVSPAVRTLGRE